ncbi:MAG: hypothetical protein GQ530_01330, partial [Desulfuromonadales bacterium]|nr:hypothetical protein [Desulfuromonadales bacterium]
MSFIATPMKGFRHMRLTSTTMTFANETVPEGTMLAGYAALVYALNVEAPLRSMSCISSEHVRGSMRQDGHWNIYDKRYWPGSSLGDHLTFAMKHEPLDLLTLKRVLEAAPEEELSKFIQSIPTGGVTRRIWFFYETLTGRLLNIPGAKQGSAVDALDPKKY